MSREKRTEGTCSYCLKKTKLDFAGLCPTRHHDGWDCPGTLYPHLGSSLKGAVYAQDTFMEGLKSLRERRKDVYWEVHKVYFFQEMMEQKNLDFEKMVAEYARSVDDAISDTENKLHEITECIKHWTPGKY